MFYYIGFANSKRLIQALKKALVKKLVFKIIFLSNGRLIKNKLMTEHQNQHAYDTFF